MILANWSLAATQPAAATRTITLFERMSGQIIRTQALLDGGEVFLPMDVWVDQLGLTRKALAGDRVGICREDLCIPFSVGDVATSIRRVGQRELVPVTYLAKALGGIAVWNAKEDELLLDLTHGPSAEAAMDDSILDLSLPDLSGKQVALTAFRGKKILLFAWASW